MSSIVLFDVPSASDKRAYEEWSHASRTKNSDGLPITHFMIGEMDGKCSSRTAHLLTTNNQVLPCEE